MFLTRCSAGWWSTEAVQVHVCLTDRCLRFTSGQHSFSLIPRHLFPVRQKTFPVEIVLNFVSLQIYTSIFLKMPKPNSVKLHVKGWELDPAAVTLGLNPNSSNTDVIYRTIWTCSYKRVGKNAFTVIEIRERWAEPRFQPLTSSWGCEEMIDILKSQVKQTTDIQNRSGTCSLCDTCPKICCTNERFQCFFTPLQLSDLLCSK